MAERQKNMPETGRSLPIALIRARERVMGPIRNMLVDAGVTEQQWRVLRVLGETGATEATQLAERASLLAPSLTRILQTLHDKGYIQREANLKDRRRQIITITPAGRAVIDANIDRATSIAKRAERLLGPERHRLLLDLLEELDGLQDEPDC